MRHWRAVVRYRREGRQHDETVTFPASDAATARAAIANWLIDRPEYWLVALAEVCE